MADLPQKHGFTHKRVGAVYYFDTESGDAAFEDGYVYIARGLQAALAFAEGFDRVSSLNPDLV